MDGERRMGLAGEGRLVEMMVVREEGDTSQLGSSLGVPHCQQCLQSLRIRHLWFLYW